MTYTCTGSRPHQWSCLAVDRLTTMLTSYLLSGILLENLGLVYKEGDHSTAWYGLRVLAFFLGIRNLTDAVFCQAS